MKRSTFGALVASAVVGMVGGSAALAQASGDAKACYRTHCGKSVAGHEGKCGGTKVDGLGDEASCTVEYVRAARPADEAVHGKNGSIVHAYTGEASHAEPGLEAEIASGRRIRTMDDAREAARAIIERADVGGVLITLGERGMWVSVYGVEGALPATAREVSDVTGAGDTVIATLALALAAGASPAEGAALANQAAGIAVGKFGAATVSADDLRQRFAA